jgi:hypothetical protein
MSHEKVIATLRAQIEAKEREVRELDTQLDAACTAMLTEKHNLFDGAILERNGKRFLFAGFEAPSSCGWVKGRLLKKDGTPSDVVRTLYSTWKIVKPT